MAFTATSCDVNGCKLSLRRAGSGETLLFLHGTDGLTEFPAALDRLAEDFEVVAPDHPGFGDTAIPPWIDDMSDMAYFYLDAVARLGLSGIHVVGHSLGAWIALEMAVRSCHDISSLTLISAAGIHVKGVPKADIFIIDPEEFARLSYADPCLGEAAAEHAAAEKYQDVAVLNRIASARLGWNPRFFNPRLERWLHRVTVPTQIVWGDQDRIIPPPYAAAFHRLIPGSMVTTIARSGHMPHVEHADEVVAAIRDFIAAQRKDSPT